MESPQTQKEHEIHALKLDLQVCLKFSDLPGSRRDKGNHDFGHGLRAGGKEGRIINEQGAPDC